MTFSDELGKLGELHQRGVLSDEEFARAKARVLGQPAAQGHENAAISAVNALRRSRADRWLGGVCSGLADLSGLAAWAWRLTFTLLALLGGTGIAVYLLLWILVPDADVAGATGRAETA